MKDCDLENILVVLYELPSEKAADISERMTFHRFSETLQRLESVIGEENAAALVKEGELFSYGNGMLESYFRAAIRAAGKLSIDQSDPRFKLRMDIPKERLKIFRSIASLNEYLSATPHSDELGASRLNLAQYTLLHLDNPTSVAYFSTLVENGELVIGEDERWSRNGQGARGLDVIFKIAFQLSQVFNELGLGRPKYDIKHNHRKIILDENTRALLSRIKDETYAAQKKK